MADAIILEIPDIKGECQLDSYTDKITVLSMNHGMTQPMTMDPTNQARTVGRMNCQDLSVTKILDSSSVPLIDAMNTAKNLATCKIYILKSTGDTAAGQKLVLTYEMEETMISSYSVGIGGGGEGTETITLNFTKITWTYVPQKSTGEASGNVTSNWSLKLGKKS
jgi:type VI secretion system secreted protein Hcp